jgi:hypothetical protein
LTFRRADIKPSKPDPSGNRRPQLREDIERAVLGFSGAGQAQPDDADAYLRLIEASQVALEECSLIQVSAVHRARRADNSWAAIGDLLGISRQAAQQRFAPGSEEDLPGDGLRVIAAATAFNEMQILNIEGAAGFHLVGFGALHLTVKASRQRWEHRREMAINIAVKRTRLEAAGWSYVGSWFPFHYFKRVMS